MNNITNYNLNRRIRQALYVLKRAFGSTIALYQLTSASTSYTTGVKSLSSTSITIPRCIVLPVRLQREVLQTVAQMSANKTFSYGGSGSFESGVREFIIDARDLPSSYTISLEDWIVYDNRRYDFKNMEQLEQNTGWHITGKEILGPPLAKITQVTDSINFTESTDNG